MTTLNEQFYALEQTLHPKDFRLEVMQMLCRAATPIQVMLSEHGRSALVLASKYWQGMASAQEVDRIREEVWRELDAITSVESEEGHAWVSLRAVACLMYPTIEPEDVLDLVELYLGLLRRLGFSDPEIDLTLRSPSYERGSATPGAR